MRQFLILLSIFFSHYPQLKIPLVSTTTRPFFQFFFLPILILNARKIRMKKPLQKKWIFFSITFFFYLVIGLLLYQDIKIFIRYSIGFFFLILFYLFGYTFSFLNEKSFYLSYIITFIPATILGILQVLGITYNQNLMVIANSIRSNLLSVVLDKIRLTLFFSEPSFLASYLLLLLFIIARLKELHPKENIRILLNILELMIIIFTIYSKSIYVYLTIGTLFLLRVISSKSTITRKLTYLIFSFTLITIFVYMNLTRIIKILNFDDLSFLARIIYIKALISMFFSSHYLGLGIGSFGIYFCNFLNNKYFLIFPNELYKYLNCKIHAVPFSLFFQFLGETGIIGTFTFLWLIFHNFKNSKYKPYYISAFITTISALPWGLPYFWILVGLLHKLSQQEVAYSASTTYRPSTSSHNGR